MEVAQSLIIAAVGLSVVVVVVLLCREVTCWYFKINRIVKSLEAIALHYEKNPWA
jgi:hypothetical protein